MDKFKRDFNKEKRQSTDHYSRTRLGQAYTRMDRYGGQTTKIKGNNSKAVLKANSGTSLTDLQEWQQGAESKLGLAKGSAKYLDSEVEYKNNAEAKDAVATNRRNYIKRKQTIAKHLGLPAQQNITNNNTNNTVFDRKIERTAAPTKFTPYKKDEHIARNWLGEAAVSETNPIFTKSHYNKSFGKKLPLYPSNNTPFIKKEDFIGPREAVPDAPESISKSQISKDLRAEQKANLEQRAKLPLMQRLFNPLAKPAPEVDHDGSMGKGIMSRVRGSSYTASADGITAAFMGLNTEVGTETTELARPTKGIKAIEVSPEYEPRRDTGFGGLNEEGNIDQTRAGRLNTQETINASALPKSLVGISNLSESDQRLYGRAYNQDLMNNKLGNRAGYADLQISDISNSDGVTGRTLSSKGFGNARSLTTGYGMGWGNAWRADRSVHAARALSTINPLSRGNMSIMGEALGRTSTRDKLALKANPSIMNRIGAKAAPMFAIATVGYGMYDNQDAGDIAINLLAPAVGLAGGRAGLSVGAMITPGKNAKNFGVLRAIGMGGGALTGFALGAGAVMAVGAGLKDGMSNDSSIRKFAKNIASSEIYTKSTNTRQSLTARQMALNKLSRSGLNDRSLLLANEAAMLKGLI